MLGGLFTVVLSTVEEKDVAIFNRKNLAIFHHNDNKQVTYQKNGHTRLNPEDFWVCYIAAE